jgi:hypothetical protein
MRALLADSPLIPQPKISPSITPVDADIGDKGF